MNDLCTYHLRVSGPVEESELNAMSPVQVSVDQRGEAITLLIARTDQSGMVGLVRHLHGQGFTIVSVINVTVLNEQAEA